MSGGVPFWLSTLVTQKFNYRMKTLPKNLFYGILCLPFQQGKLERTAIFVSHEWFLGHFLTF